LQAKQDGLFNREEQTQLTREGEAWKGHTKGVINLCLIWVPGHHGFASNKHADEEVKKATQGGGEMVPVWLLHQETPKNL
jgi:ribonuclease HI